MIMKWVVFYLIFVAWLWTTFPDNYSTGERGLILVPLGFPLLFYFVYKTVGYRTQEKVETMSYEPDAWGGSDSDCGSSDGGCDGGD